MAGVTTSAGEVKKIADRCRDKVGALKEINESFRSITQVVKNNAATSQESADAAKQLSDQAVLLDDLKGPMSLS